MSNQLKSLKPLGRFNFKEDSLPDLENFVAQQADTYKVETVICLESVLYNCYQALVVLVHSQAIRKECQRFERRTQQHQTELRRIFPLSPGSEDAVTCKVYECLMQLKPPYLFLRAVIGLAISLNACKIDIYKYLYRTENKHRDLLNNFIQDSVEEMNFLRQGIKLSQNSTEDTSFKGVLEKVIYYLHCV